MKQKFGRYRLLAKLAQGGMAHVYLAEQSGFGGFTKKVVVKRMRSSSARSDDMREMFFTEAVVAGQLNHPNLVQLFDFVEDDGERFIVMEYVDGPSVKKLLQLARDRQKQLPIEHCLKIASLVCEGLHYAHLKRDDRTGERIHLIHRDITPDNILFARSGAVKIADFGIAKATTQLHETRPGDVKGKLAYIAPEQLLSQPIDARVDVFGLGVVLHEMLTGVGPFARENDAAVMDAIIHDEVAPLNALRPEAPPALDALIRKATAKKREERFGSALELQEALDAALAKTWPGLGAAQLRALLEDLDPTRRPSDEEETKTDASPLKEADPGERGTEIETLPPLAPPTDPTTVPPERQQPAGRAPTRDPMPVSVDIPITGMAAVPPPAPPPPRPRSIVVPVLLAVVLTAAVSVSASLYLLRQAAVIVVRDEPAKPAPVAVKTEPESGNTDAAAIPETVVAKEPEAEKSPPAPAPEPAEPPSPPLKGAARVTVRSEPEADVYLDGRNIGHTPLAVPMKFGKRKLRFENTEVRLNKTVTLKVPEQRELEQSYTFEKARLFVMAPDGATVYLGKHKAGKLPMKPVELYEGTYHVRVVYAPLGLDVTKRLDIKPGDRFEPFAAE